MGDGSKQNDGLHLNTYGFKLDGINILLKSLDKKLNINCGGSAAKPTDPTLHNHKSGYRIYISKKDLYTIKPLIIPHMNKEMLYKLGE